MSAEVAVLICPGRGSYGRDELGSLHRWLSNGELAELLQHADRVRSAAGEPRLAELDRAERFRPGVHLQGRNAAELIWFATLAHVERLRERYAIAAVLGNSLGWYTALAASGAVSFADGWHLVRTMARLQEAAAGGQVLTTTVDAEWRADPRLVRAVDQALEVVDGEGETCHVARSIRLGGHEVLAGTDAGLARLLEMLPEVAHPGRTFPFRLAGHGPFHTRLCEPVARAASAELGDLPCRGPAVHLIDGRGTLHTPWSTDPAELLRYTLTEQVVTTFDFSAAVRTALREIQPDVVLCAGPGTSLRAPVGHVVLHERWRGITTREALFESGVVVSPKPA